MPKPTNGCRSLAAKRNDAEIEEQRKHMIKLKRSYDEPSKRDGLRILVERLWPRGISKEKAAIDLWLKDLAPSTELRNWFGHDSEKWGEFRKRYWSELEQKGDLLVLLKHRTIEGTVTFVYAASDEEHNSALALKEFLEEQSIGAVCRGRAIRPPVKNHPERSLWSAL